MRALTTTTTCSTHQAFLTLNTTGCSRSFRRLEQRHPGLQTTDSPTQRVGGGVRSDLPKVRHTVPMLSIRTETDAGENGARAFDARIRRELGLGAGDPPVEYSAELKFDGLAINLRYERGVLVRAATRGDGEVGRRCHAQCSHDPFDPAATAG